MPVPPAMISSPPAVTSRSVWSARFEPGPRTLNGDSLVSLPTTRSAPHATPAATGRGLVSPRARVRLLRIVALLEARAPRMDIAGGPSVQPLPCTGATTIQSAGRPPAIVPVTLNRCHEVVSVTCVGPASYVVHTRCSTMAIETVIVPDGNLEPRHRTCTGRRHQARDVLLDETGVAVLAVIWSAVGCHPARPRCSRSP